MNRTKSYSGVRVLSLFNGIGCASVALRRAGVNVERMYSSEVCPSALAVDSRNNPDSVQLGDVLNWKSWALDLSKIDLVVGGSPCQGFSRAGKEGNFFDSRSALFFVFVDILNAVKAANPSVNFLLENVKMRAEYTKVISDHLGVSPTLLDGKDGHLQSRPRNYWCSWTVANCVKGPHGALSDILSATFDGRIHNTADVARVRGLTEDERGYRPHRGDARKTGISEIGRILKPGAKYSDTITTSHRPKIFVALSGDVDVLYRAATIVECERLMGLPDNYTAGLSEAASLRCIGNAWHVGIVSEIFAGFRSMKYPTLNNARKES